MMVSAVTPPTLGGDYGSIDGVLGTDTYTLYPWDESSVNVGFSKYGELINPVDGVGLEYKGIDVLANPVVPQSEWNNGWLSRGPVLESRQLCRIGRTLDRWQF